MGTETVYNIGTKVFTGFVVVLSLLGIPARAAGDEALKKRVLAEYPSALERLEGKFVPVRGRAVVRMVNNQHTVTKTVDFAFDENQKKIVEKYDPRPDKPYDEIVYCYNKNYSFKLNRKTSNGSYMVVDYSNDTAPAREKIGLEIGFAAYPAWRVNPYSLVPLTDPLASISEAIKTSKYKLVDASEDAIDGVKCVKIKYSFVYKYQNKPHDGSDTLWVVPDDGWALHRMVTDVHDPSTNETQEAVKIIDVKYRREGDPMLMPSRVEVKRSKVEDDSYEFQDYRFGEIADREFTFEYFGLPDLTAVGDGTGLSTAWWLVGMAVACLAVGLILKLYSDRAGRAGSVEVGRS